MFELNGKYKHHYLYIFVILLSSLGISACANTKSNDFGSDKLLVEDFSDQRKLTEEVSHKEVQKHIQSISKNPKIFDHLDEERLVIMNYILTEIKKRDMPAELAMIPLIESSYRPSASNNGQYVGLWQFGRQTAINFGIDVQKNYDGRYNPAISTKAALDYLEYLNKMFDGDWLLTMAAYNAGEGRVLKSVKANRQKGKGTDYWSIDLPQVTRAYIPKVLALSEVMSEKRETLISINQEEIPQLVRVRAESPEVMRKILKESNISKEVIDFYNPNIAKRNNARGIVIPESEVKHLKGIPKNQLEKYIIYGSKTAMIGKS